MREIKLYVGLITLMILFYSCQKPIDIKATTTNANILVVEGFINTVDSTKISLSRTVRIGNKTTANPELNAQITLENATGTVSALQQLGKGLYATPSLVLDNTKQYRIRIKTSDGKTYLSDLTDAKITQPIDDVGYNATNDGISIYANTHDVTNNSRYYLYNYEETWEFRSLYSSSYRSNGMAIVTRSASEMVDHCYSYLSPSVNIVLASTAALAQDVLYQAPITNIASNSEKLGIKYSILVTQTALTKDAYIFWGNLWKNTEKLGSIFDVQPSQLTGNVHNINDASEPVIGYISAGTRQSKRIFIKRSDLPTNYRFEYPYSCSLDTALYSNNPVKSVGVTLVPLSSPYMPVSSIINPITGDIIGFPFSSKPCGDCTIRGTVQKPAFWQ